MLEKAWRNKMTCPICGRLYCDHSSSERGQSYGEMMKDMQAPHIIVDGITKKVSKEEYAERMNGRNNAERVRLPNGGLEDDVLFKVFVDSDKREDTPYLQRLRTRLSQKREADRIYRAAEQSERSCYEPGEAVRYYLEAGQLYEKAGLNRDALRCYCSSDRHLRNLRIRNFEGYNALRPTQGSKMYDNLVQKLIKEKKSKPFLP